MFNGDLVLTFIALVVGFSKFILGVYSIYWR